MTTIYDVAKAAGVTATTVSNVLSGKGRVGPATRKRVMQYVQDLKYQPNLIARSLINGRTGIVGLVVHAVDNPFYAEAISIVERLAYEAGIRVFMTTLPIESVVGEKLLGDLTLRRVDGLLVTSGNWSIETISAIVGSDIPMVYCFAEEGEGKGVPSVAFDFLMGGRLVAEHLLSLGHQRIGIVTDMREDGSLPHQTRITGLQEALARKNLPFDPTLIQAGQSTLEGAKTAARRLLTSPEPPTALFATNDLMALGAMSAAWELSLRIPHDLSIVGHDNVSLAQFTQPPLTTVAIDKVAMLSQTITMLLTVIEGQPVVSPPTSPATLIVRESTGPCTQ